MVNHYRITAHGRDRKAWTTVYAVQGLINVTQPVMKVGISRDPERQLNELHELGLDTPILLIDVQDSTIARRIEKSWKIDIAGLPHLHISRAEWNRNHPDAQARAGRTETVKWSDEASGAFNAMLDVFTHYTRKYGFEDVHALGQLATQSQEGLGACFLEHADRSALTATARQS